MSILKQDNVSWSAVQALLGFIHHSDKLNLALIPGSDCPPQPVVTIRSMELSRTRRDAYTICLEIHDEIVNNDGGDVPRQIPTLRIKNLVNEILAK